MEWAITYTVESYTGAGWYFEFKWDSSMYNYNYTVLQIRNACFDIASDTVNIH
jgi:hypothetical protein